MKKIELENLKLNQLNEFELRELSLSIVTKDGGCPCDCNCKCSCSCSCSGTESSSSSQSKSLSDSQETFGNVSFKDGNDLGGDDRDADGSANYTPLTK